MVAERRYIFSALVLIVMLVPLVISSRRFGYPRRNPSEEEFLEEGDRLYILANKVRPSEDSCEQYSYFDFPFCPAADPIIYKKKSLKDVLAGDCHTITNYELRFKKNTENKILCEKSLTKDDVAKLRDAIKRFFVYDMSYNNFILRETVGNIEEVMQADSRPVRLFLATGIEFVIEYTENKVTEMFIQSVRNFDVDIREAADLKVNFTYSVHWFKSEEADNSSLSSNEMPHEEDQRPQQDAERWMSVLTLWANVTLVWVSLLLLATVPYLMKYLKRCSNRGGGHSQSSQHIFGDACICPKYTSLLGAILGNGIQLFISICIFFILAYRGFLNPCYLKLLCSQILRTYCFTSVVAGYKATSFHGWFTPFGWKECTFQAGTVYFIPALITTLIANCLAITNSGMSDIPELGIMYENLVVWGIVTVILLSLGGTLGHCTRPELEPPCTTRRLPRDIPHKSWHTKTPAQMLVGGLLPSLAIFPEMDNIYASLWHFKICGAFYLMLTSFVVLIMLTVVVAIGFTSYQFAKYDHQWWWRSVLRGGSPAIFMFLYGIHFLSKVPDLGDSMKLRILGYNACISYALFLMLGTISFYASLFVFHSTYPPEKHE